MTNQDSVVVTRRPLDVEDYIDVARRHKGWIVGTTFAGIVLAVVIARFVPPMSLHPGQNAASMEGLDG